MKLSPYKTTFFAKWVAKLKPTIDGSNFKHNAQLMAHGFQQKEGIDFYFFALIIKWGTIQTIIVFAIHNNWKVFHLGIKTMFLNKNLNNEMYLFQS